MDTKYVVISGYVSTGSSAVTDLLKEYEGFWAPNIEFRLIKDPHGLIDLRHVLINRWDPLNVDIAIKDFVWFTRHLSHQNSKLSLVSGMGYSSPTAFGERFQKATDEFVSKLVKYEYTGTWHFIEFRQDKLHELFRKVQRKLGSYTKDRMYFSDISEEEFDKAVREYLDALFYQEGTNNRVYLLDQAFPAQHPQLLNAFLDHSKMIVVDRDPRDVYVSMYDHDHLLCHELRKSHNVDLYIDWYRNYRRNKADVQIDPNVLIINFEDLIIHYDNSVSIIEKFLNLSSNIHTNRKGFLKPEVSIKNVGIWKNFEFPDDIQKITESLQEYLWRE